MKQTRRDVIIGILFVLGAGTLSHFLYDWSGRQPVVGLITPVNESVWEHMKLLFFPMLLYALVTDFLHRKKSPCILPAYYAGILAGTFLIPALYYTYTSLLGRNVFLLDIGTFLLSVLAAFRISYRLAMSCRTAPHRFLLSFFTVILLICFLWFTYHPPSLQIFADPAKAEEAACKGQEKGKLPYHESASSYRQPPYQPNS